MPAPHPSSTLAAVRSRVYAGQPAGEIERETGVPAVTIRRWRRTHGWPHESLEPEAFDPAVRVEAFARIDGGESITSTARALGVSRKTISRWLRARGTSLEPGSVNTPRAWRCDCTAFGVRVEGPTCPACGTTARWADEETSSS